MRKIDFSDGWTCRCITTGGEAQAVTIPHDAMISAPRTGRSTGAGNIGWFEGYDYEYRKIFTVPAELQGKNLVLEFEGVYHEAEVYLNDEKVIYRPYGYTNFYIDLTGKVREGAENELRVLAKNSDQPNSRWYSGTGIYRPVNLYTAGDEHILLNGLRITTVSYDPAQIEVEVRTSVPGTVQVEITGKYGAVVAAASVVTTADGAAATAAAGNGATDGAAAGSAANTAAAGTAGSGAAGSTASTAAADEKDEVRAANAAAGQAYRTDGASGIVRIDVPRAELWSVEEPNLYVCRAMFGDDTVESTFGIRLLAWTPENGMTINGERVIVRGACIHHDNGLLGACAYPEAEERKVRILKENGYNALRSAHNPCSRAILDACDRLGMLMMDEFVDCWYMHKTKYDYALHVMDWWRADLRDMVGKDYNHPCVIAYSTGNEVAETAQEKGIAFTGQMTDYLHELDATRPVSCGINIFFNFLSSIGLGVYSDDKSEKEAAAAEKAAEKEAAAAAEGAKAKKKKPVGSEFYNTLACLMGDWFMKTGATLPPCDWKTRGAYANMDFAGYNYGIFRYEKDLKKYPKRLILGSETFCKDAYDFWEIAKKHPRIIGDFVWAGMDYIGETGIGATEYKDYFLEQDESHMTGGNGRVDLLGFPRAEAAYTRVALERETGPYIAVNPVYENEKLQLTGWQLTKAIESWSWRGCAGREATVEVYARGASVELLLNGKSVGKKKIRKARANFKFPYEDGELTAVSYDETGKEINRYTLTTAGEETELRVTPESESVRKGGIVFVPIEYTDAAGIRKPMEKSKLKATVKHGELLGFGSANPYVEGNYTENVTKTYFGQAMAIVRADGTGDVEIRIADKTGPHKAVVKLEK